MRHVGVLVLCTVFICFAGYSAYGADALKIAVFDLGKILEGSEAGKAAQQELNAEGKKMADQLKKKGAELEELKKRLEQESLVLTEEKRAEKEREFRLKINDLKELQRKYSREARDIQEKIKDEIEDDLKDIITEIGKKEKFTLIFEKNQGGLWYHPTAVDITQEIIRQYNDMFSREKSKKKQ